MQRVSWMIGVAWLASTSLAGEVLAFDGGPTFNKDVAPILWKNCAGCHRPGEVGPFPLLTYKDAAKRADFLVDITESRRMPPWKPEPGFGEFHDEQRLTEKELKTLADWSKNGTPEGDPKDLPALPTFSDGWQLGTPDLVLKMPESYTVPADGRDVYRVFVIPIPTDSDKTVAAVEFRPGNRKVVHHALLFLDRTGAARAKDAEDSGPGFASFGGPGFLPTGALGGWAPGAMPRMLPDGMGKMLQKGSDLALQIHYHPDGKPETDQSSVGVYFTKSPARQIVGAVRVATRDIKIPPDESRYGVHVASPPLPVDAYAIGITPHMHYIAKEVKVVAEVPGGQTIPMIWIKDWDFNWQGQYQYKSPVKLPKGTVIKLDAFYDNSADNPNNPSSPPKLVTFGEQTTDEMCLLGVQVVTDKNSDLRQIMTMNLENLKAQLKAEMGRQNGAGGGKLLEGLRRRGGGAGANPGAGGIGANGFKIPPAAKDRLDRFDTNKDGRISKEELDAMPPAARERIMDAIRNRMGGAGEKGNP